MCCAFCTKSGFFYSILDPLASPLLSATLSLTCLRSKELRITTFCSLVHLRAALPGVKLVQVIHVMGDEALAEAQAAAHDVDAILLDSGNTKIRPESCPVSAFQRSHILRRVALTLSTWQ